MKVISPLRVTLIDNTARVTLVVLQECACMGLEEVPNLVKLPLSINPASEGHQSSKGHHD